jgi:hypothetical protein
MINKENDNGIIPFGNKRKLQRRGINRQMY